jgi:hypothetical protein
MAAGSRQLPSSFPLAWCKRDEGGLLGSDAPPVMAPFAAPPKLSSAPSDESEDVGEWTPPPLPGEACGLTTTARGL